LVKTKNNNTTITLIKRKPHALGPPLRPAGEGVCGLGAQQDHDSGSQPGPAEQLGEGRRGRGLRPEGGGPEAFGGDAPPVRLLQVSADGRHTTQRRAGAAAGGGGAGVLGVARPGSGFPLHPSSEGAAEAPAGAAERTRPEHQLNAGKRAR